MHLNVVGPLDLRDGPHPPPGGPLVRCEQQVGHRGVVLRHLHTENLARQTSKIGGKIKKKWRAILKMAGSIINGGKLKSNIETAKNIKKHVAGQGTSQGTAICV